MTKKDYVLIANVFNKFCDPQKKERFIIACDIAYIMSDTLQSENPRFDREKFLRACGVEQKCYKNTISCGLEGTHDNCWIE